MDYSTTNLFVVPSQYHCWSLLARCVCNPTKELGKAEGDPFSAVHTSLYPSSAHTSTGLSTSGPGPSGTGNAKITPRRILDRTRRPSPWDRGSENISSRGRLEPIWNSGG